MGKRRFQTPLPVQVKKAVVEFPHSHYLPKPHPDGVLAMMVVTRKCRIERFVCDITTLAPPPGKQFQQPGLIPGTPIEITPAKPTVTLLAVIKNDSGERTIRREAGAGQTQIDWGLTLSPRDSVTFRVEPGGAQISGIYVGWMQREGEDEGEQLPDQGRTDAGLEG